ncbi:kikA from plasmid origin, partial [Klebsiella pneumoniae]
MQGNHHLFLSLICLKHNLIRIYHEKN